MNVDFSALTQPVTPEQIREYKASRPPRWKISKVLATLIAVPGIIITLLVVGGAISVGTDGIIALCIFLVPILILFITLGLGLRFSTKRRTQLFFFAKANAMTLIVDRASPSYAGLIFNYGSDQKIHEALVLSDGKEIGNYSYTVRSGKNSTTYTWGYMRVKLVRRLPNMVLDARKNNLFGSKMTNLPSGLGGNQVLQLEGNFNDFFTLHVPKGYERDALYVFTPDVMSALIDFGAQYDMEVVDDNLFFYSTHYIKLNDEATLTQLFSILDKVSNEIIDQGDYYADERVGNREANIIAAPGRRLKSRVGIVSIIFVALYFLYIIWQFIAGFMSN